MHLIRQKLILEKLVGKYRNSPLPHFRRFGCTYTHSLSENWRTILRAFPHNIHPFLGNVYQLTPFLGNIMMTHSPSHLFSYLSFGHAEYDIVYVFYGFPQPSTLWTSGTKCLYTVSQICLILISNCLKRSQFCLKHVSDKMTQFGLNLRPFWLLLRANWEFF